MSSLYWNKTHQYICSHTKSVVSFFFADDINILVFTNDPNEPNSKLNLVLCCVSKQFQNNQLVLNLNKMCII